MNDKPMDLRSRYSQKVIMEALLGLLDEKPVDKITVTDICTGRRSTAAHFINII